MVYYKSLIIAIFVMTMGFFSSIAHAQCSSSNSLTQDAIIDALGWVSADINRCGGYYIDPAIVYPESILHTKKLFITSDQGLFSFHGTSMSQGKVTISRAGQEISANKAYLYRDPKTGKLSAIDFFGNVKLHEPNQLVVGNSMHLDIKTNARTLNDILYRAAIYGDLHPLPLPVSYSEQQRERKITQMSAWGQAESFSQTEPKIFMFKNASYTTCPPNTCVWKVKAKTLVLNKNTGRGYATGAQLFFKRVPVFYAPYFNFPIDARRQTGFLFPRVGSSGSYGPFLMTPFYWNLAPNYDTTISPAYLSKRGLQITDLYRYLTPTRRGQIEIDVLPNDKAFRRFQIANQEIYQNSTSTFVQADLRQLINASTTRKAFSWKEEGHYNENWSSVINYNYVGDSYYLRDFNNNIDQVNDNQLLQLAEVDYTAQYVNMLGRLQSYQTLNQVDQNTVPTSYSRFPQFALGADYPSQFLGLEYLMNIDATRFDIRNTPGDSSKLPMGYRTNLQPGISRPLILPYFYIIPRAQVAETKYNIGRVIDTPKNPSRFIPIFDLSSGLYFDRSTTWLGHPYKQTLEPQIYYTYIPYVNQDDLPLFDTTLNIPTYDQLFTYNRFSGLDRIGDANQISLGLTTRYIDNTTGYEKITAAVGEIFYFKKREVTLCTTPGDCSFFEDNTNNRSIHSPLSGSIKYYASPNWTAVMSSIWNQKTNQIDNQNITLQYKPAERKILNLGYNFVRSGDNVLPWEPPTSPTTNLSQTDVSGAWPISRDWALLGRWREDWNQRRLQNLLGGLQYDSCCWAMRVVAGRTFVALNPNGTLQYNNQFYIEFSLKGLGNYGASGDSSSLLASSIAGYQSNFGRNY